MRMRSRGTLAGLVISALLLSAAPANAQYEGGYAPPPPGPMSDANYFRISPKLSAGAIIPFGEGYADSVGGGLALDAAIWAELPHSFAIEMRVGLRFDLVRSNNSYGEIPFDLGFFYLLGRGPIAFVIGGGVGAHHLWETRERTITVGNVLVAKTVQENDDKGWGFGVFGRLGMLIRGNRASRGSVLLSGEVTTTFIRLNDAKNPTAVLVMASVLY